MFQLWRPSSFPKLLRVGVLHLRIARGTHPSFFLSFCTAQSPVNATAASPPPTPSSELPDKAERRLIDTCTPCEWVELYRPGKFHPVNLGDTFQDGKYKVIRKLGYGASSTVWLAVSSSRPKYVVLKVVRADSRTASKELAIMDHLLSVAHRDPDLQYVRTHTDSFIHSGPNGKHQCLVFEVMGASANWSREELTENQPKKWNNTQRYPKCVAKKLLLHSLRGLALLHRYDVVQADFQPGNMLFGIESIEQVREEDLEQDVSSTTQFNTPEPVKRTDGKVDLWAPKNLYLTQSLHDRVKLGPDLCVKLSDFGGAFFAHDPPSSPITPRGLRAPELILRRPFDKSIDIWSFGCLVYEFLTGEQLFCVYGWAPKEYQDDDHLCQLNDKIQRLPKDFMDDWPRAGNWFDAEHKYLRRDGEIIEPYEPLEEHFAKRKHPDIDDEEVATICQLIRKILVYDPAERPSAEELLKHPWFSE